MATSYPGAVDGTYATHQDVDDAVKALQTTLGTNPQVASPDVKARIGRLTFPSVEDFGLYGMTTSIPTGATVQAGVSGRQYFTRIRLPAQTITNLMCGVRAAGATFTNTNTLALFTSAGAKVAETGDLATTFNSQGFKTIPLSSPYASPGGYFYVGWLTSATTNPSLSANVADATSNILANLGPSGMQMAYTDSTTRTAWLTNYTFTSLTATNTTIWFGAA